jgi:hypothetical protein
MAPTSIAISTTHLTLRITFDMILQAANAYLALSAYSHRDYPWMVISGLTSALFTALLYHDLNRWRT